MAFDAYIQRADDYITRQINKFEQQKRGNKLPPPRPNGYEQVPPLGGFQGRPTQSNNQYPPPPAGNVLPDGWIQEYDRQSQRWYFFNRATGRSQWNPPSHGPPRAATFQPHVPMPNPQRQFTREDEQRWRARSNSQPQRPVSSGSEPFLDPRQSSKNGGSSPGLHTQLPPGAHYDMKTGKIVNNMFPEGQCHQTWAQELQRI